MVAAGHSPLAPETWSLPSQSRAFEAACSEDQGHFILKPDQGCRGRGIVLRRGGADALEAWRTTMGAEPVVVQRYLERPLLLERRKFDLRLYVLVTAVVPEPRAWVFREGLVRRPCQLHAALMPGAPQLKSGPL